jgi:hypothetical protein
VGAAGWACAEVEIVPLMLAERGERAKVQNEIVDAKHDAAGLILMGTQ